MAGSGFDNRNHKLLIALRHPLRRAILREMRDGDPISPRELAERLGERLSNVAYHVRVLAQCGAVAPAGNKDVRGATQHFYRWSLEEEWAQEILNEGEGDSPKGKS